jgi:hypothetical protein
VGGTRYVFETCTSAAKAGDVIAADSFTLHVHKGSKKAGKTVVTFRLGSCRGLDIGCDARVEDLACGF